MCGRRHLYAQQQQQSRPSVLDWVILSRYLGHAMYQWLLLLPIYETKRTPRKHYPHAKALCILTRSELPSFHGQRWQATYRGIDRSSVGVPRQEKKKRKIAKCNLRGKQKGRGKKASPVAKNKSTCFNGQHWQNAE